MQRRVNNKRVRYLLGDVRDRERVARALRCVDYVVHAAALKIIPLGEYNPDEVIKTNILGSANVIYESINAGVKRVVVTSSDKAVAPTNLYGHTKAAMENLARLANLSSGQTDVLVCRYGNVISSRGSIFTILRKMADEGCIKLTHPEMTRFFITLEDSCEFVMNVLNYGDPFDIFIPKMASVKLLDVVRNLCPEVPVVFTGMRPGEKLHEWLTNEYEVYRTERDWVRVENPLENWEPQHPLSSENPVFNRKGLYEAIRESYQGS